MPCACVGLGQRTSVIGMFGALGKMKETSSNLLRLRQFSARNILRWLDIHMHNIESPLPASPAVTQSMCHDDGSRVSLERRNNQRRLVSHDEFGLEYSERDR